MGIPDNSLLHLIKKISSWINWENIEMSENNCNMCFHCQAIMSDSCLRCHCQGCGRLFCEKCVPLDESALTGLMKTTWAVFNVKTCNLCFNPRKTVRRCSGKIYPSESPRQSPEPPSPSFSGEGFSENPSPVSVRRSLSRSDEDEGEDSSNYFSASSEYYHDSGTDVDSVCVSSRRDFCSYTTSVGSSPSDSPSRIHITSNRVGHFVQQDNNEQAVLEKPAKHIWDPQKVDGQKASQPLDFESNGLIWFPPPADGEENSFFTYDDEEDDFGDSDAIFSPDDGILGREKQHLDQKEPLRGAVEGHFRLLVSQLLQGEKCDEDWINIITAISWKAANFIKPDTSRGGSMDPSDYVKVKCVASGSRSESKVIKGVVCTKNIKHKRMTSQYKNTRLLLLGGALEYQRDPNQLASFNTLLQQEKDHLKMIVSKIEAHRPNVLLVEKSVSSFAQDQLLEKEISLVLNVKRPLLERIARCTGAVITPSTDKISSTRLGHCELFHLEKVSEEHEQANQFNRKPSKTLMFFEGCPRRLGCTVLLRGSSREELKKVKNVVQYAIFAAYHLSLETSFLADEGASLPTRIGSPVPDLDLGLKESISELSEDGYDENSLPDEFRYRKALSEACIENLALDEGPTNDIKADEDYFSANDSNQSILVSFSSHSVLNETICERPRLVRVKFYGPSDKPLGRYLRDDLFDKLCRCRSCKESCEAHAICYTHPNGNLTINVRQISSAKLPGEEDGKIWMWHRCLKCTHTEGVPPATRRVVMSDAAWGLSFGKFLELSFSNHATGNRLATCGHSLQRDCLRFYGFGNMVAFFQYSPINVLSVCLPPSVLEFSCPGEQSWIRKEAEELLGKSKVLYAEISAALEKINQRSLSAMHEFSDASDLHSHVLELYNMLSKEENYYEDLLQLDHKENLDILEINRLRHSLLVGSNVWDRRLYLLDSLLRRSSIPEAPNDVNLFAELKNSEDKPLDYANLQECLPEEPKLESTFHYEENFVNDTSLERLPSAGSILSDQIDSAWSGADVAASLEAQFLDHNTPSPNRHDNPAFRRLLSPTRVYSFDSAQILQERLRKKEPNSMHLSTLRSFHASGDYKYMVRDPVPNVQRTYSQISAPEAEKLNLTTESAPHSFISSTFLLPEGARLIVPQNGEHDIVVTVYDNEPTSIISHALSSKEYSDWILNKHPNKPERVNSVASELSKCHSFSSLDLDNYGSYCSEDESKSSPHLRISFKDNSTPATSGSVKFSVTCYFAKQFDALRRKSCPNEVDFIRSLSRCMKWKAQGGKSNVYFAKSFDERFIIKQVTKTELESFDEFAPDYFKYLTDSLSSGSPTCLAKVLGLYQVLVKHSKGGKETKMELMVMENLFFGRSISKVYDLKGSERSRYNSDTTGSNKVLLDMNLLETLRTNPIFLGSKAKRRLERAVWNDTSFLASVDVMDYSLLVGVDEERKELVLGIIDYMRQYTWDKHLETWVKASGILGGPKNASPTIVSPKQYKKRFRKAMTTYFLTVPDQWSSQ